MLFRFAVAISLLIAATAQSGMKAKMNDGSVELIKEVGFKLAANLSRGLFVPGVNGIKTDESGTTQNYNITNLYITNTKFNKTDLHIFNPDVFYMTAISTIVVMKGNWEYVDGYGKSNEQKYSGTFILTVKFSYQAIILRTSFDSTTGHVTVNPTQCSLGVAGHSVEIMGTSQDSVINFISTTAMEKLTSTFQSSFCTFFTVSFGKEINRVLSGVSSFAKLVSGVVLDLRVTSAPNNVQPNIFIDFSGACYPENYTSATFPFTPMALPEFSPNSMTDAQLMIGEYVLKTFLHTVHEFGLIKFTFTTSQIPSNFPFNPILFLSQIANGLAQYSSSQLSFVLTSITRPMVEIDENATKLRGDFELAFVVDQQNGATLEAFAIALAVEGEAEIKANNSKIGVKLSDVKVKVSPRRQNIEYSLVGMQAAIGGLTPLLLPLANGPLEQGIDLPSVLGFNIRDIQIVNMKNAIELSGNLANVLRFDDM